MSIDEIKGVRDICLLVVLLVFLSWEYREYAELRERELDRRFNSANQTILEKVCPPTKTCKEAE